MGLDGAFLKVDTALCKMLGYEELEHMLAHARRHHVRLAVAMLDLDRFKQVNDSLGHEAGDELLQGVALRLKSLLRDTDGCGPPGRR